MGSVILDLGAGTATVAGLTVPVTPGPDGTLLIGPGLGGARLNGAELGGPVSVRPLTFGERTRAAHTCVISSDPAAALATTIHALATAGSPDPADPAEAVVAQVVALVLAGAEEDGDGALDFAETVLLVARATGWSPSQLDAMPAVEVDALARSLAPPEHDGWTRLRLAPDSVEHVRAGLSANLLTRAQPRAISPRVARALHPSTSVPAADSASTGPAGSHTTRAEPTARPADSALLADEVGPATAAPEGDPARARPAPAPHPTTPTPLPALSSLTTAGTEEVRGGPTTALPTTTLRTDPPAAGGIPFDHLTGLDDRSGRASTRRAGHHVAPDPGGPAEVNPAGRSGRLSAVAPSGAGVPAPGALRWSARADLSVVPGSPPRARGGPPALTPTPPPPAVSAAPALVTAVPGSGPPPWALPSPTSTGDRPAHWSAPADPAVITGSWSRSGPEARPLARDHAWDRGGPTEGWDRGGLERGGAALGWGGVDGFGVDGFGVDGFGDVMAERAGAGELAVALGRLLQEEADLRGMAP